MRFIFLILFLIIFISIISVVLVDSITGNIPMTPNCPGGHTYAFYRTLEEKQDAEAMWSKAGFIPVSYEAAPESFHKSGYKGFMCLKRLTQKEYGQVNMLQRESVVTEGNSI